MEKSIAKIMHRISQISNRRSEIQDDPYRPKMKKKGIYNIYNNNNRIKQKESPYVSNSPAALFNSSETEGSESAIM